VREDVLDDFTSLELARDAYGVIFVDERDLEVDTQATERRRAEIRAARDGTPRGLERLYGRANGGLTRSHSPASEAGNREFGMD
jgi:hypothetical protein